MLWGKTLTGIVSGEDLHMSVVPKLLFVCGSTQGVLRHFHGGFVRHCEATGDTTWVLLITTGSSYLIRLPLAWLFGIYLELGLVGIWIGLCGELVIRAMLFLARFMHGGWAKKAL